MSFIPDFADASSWTASQACHIDWSEYAGKTLELYVYNNENPDDINIAPTVIGETTINKCAIEGTLNLNKTSMILSIMEKISIIQIILQMEVIML
mgnify:CR=1 FL=1